MVGSKAEYQGRYRHAFKVKSGAKDLEKLLKWQGEVPILACGELYKIVISWRNNMLNNHGFNLWADDYDKSVGISDDKNIYPFAGYKTMMNLIYGTIMKTSRAKVLDIGIGIWQAQ